MTRDEAIALLELMKREQRDDSGVPPVDSEAIAKRYVRMMSQLRGKGRRACGDDVSSDAGPQSW
jgi:hypothetical protein